MKILNDVCEKQNDIIGHMIEEDGEDKSWNTIINLPREEYTLMNYLKLHTSTALKDNQKVFWDAFTPDLQNLPIELTIKYNHKQNLEHIAQEEEVDPIIRTQFYILFSFSVHLLYMLYPNSTENIAISPEKMKKSIQMCIEYLKTPQKNKKKLKPEFIDLKDLPFEFSMKLLQPYPRLIFMIRIKPKTYFLRDKLKMLQENVDTLQKYEDAITSDPVWETLSKMYNIFNLLGPVIKASNKLLKSQIEKITTDSNIIIPLPPPPPIHTPPTAYFFTPTESKSYKLSTISNYWFYLLTFLKKAIINPNKENLASPGNFFGGAGTLYQDIIEIINYHKFSGDQLQRLICLAHGFEHCKFATNKPRNVSISNGLLQSTFNPLGPLGPLGSLWITQDKSTTFGAIIEIAQCLKNFVKAYDDANSETDHEAAEKAAENAYIYLQSLPIIVKPICSKHPIGQKSDLEDNPRNLYPCILDPPEIKGNKETNKDIKYLPDLLGWGDDNLSINIPIGDYKGTYFTGNLAFDFRKLWPDWGDLPIDDRMDVLRKFYKEVLEKNGLPALFDK